MSEIASKFIPETFLQASGGAIVAIAVVIAIISLFQKDKAFISKVFAVLFIIGISFISAHWTTYFATIFIIATAITELDFLQNLAAIIRGDKNYFDYLKSKQGAISASEAEKSKAPERNAMQYKILNTLWTKQVNHYPEFDNFWTFRINNNSPEYTHFRENAGILIGEGLVRETDEGQYYLSPIGWDYCKKNHNSFPADQWWPEEKINQMNYELVKNKS